jgi:hypothetical protein
MIYKRTGRFNARKYAVLKAMAEAGRPQTYGEIAVRMGLFPTSQVARDLQRFASYALVRRRRRAIGRKSLYFLTAKGFKRLVWLEKTKKASGAGARCTGI